MTRLPRDALAKASPPQRPQNLLRFRKAPFSSLGKHQLAVSDHVEYATAALDELDGGANPLPDLSRQTGGLRMIVSLHAVRDLDRHGGGPYFEANS
jgi:hypothetical protein